MNCFKRVIAAVLIAVLAIPAFSAYANAGGVQEQMRAVWVSTVYSLDYPNKATANSQELMEQADAIIENSKGMGMNAIILQVRPSADSFYKSELFPWSKYLTGGQEIAPENDFDPLAYWVEKAHENGLELHAWINPFRVAVSEEDYNSLSEKHPARTNPQWVVEHDGQYYFNPGIAEVRELIVDGAREIINNYPVDGIHLDDYFYPASSFDDEDTYKKYGKGFGDIGDWRRDNVNSLVSSLKAATESAEREVAFGISVGGIWANADDVQGGSDTAGNQTYLSHYADSREWVKQGWVDYICPQIYWYIGHSLADYDTLVNWWAETVRGTDVLLYIGMADYQANNKDSTSPWYGIAEIKRQIELNRSIPEISGEVHFRYKFLAENQDLYMYYRQIYGGTGYSAYPEKKLITHSAYMQGANNKFKPDSSLTRAEAAVILARLMKDENGNPIFDEKGKYTCTFTDVAKNAWYANAIGFMEQYKVLTGYSDGTYLPERTISRAEFAAVVARFEKEEAGAAATDFTDLPQSHWAAGYVASAVEKGYISGYGDGSFKPDYKITRAETVKIVNRMLNRYPDKEYIDSAPGVNGFTDINSKHWAYYEVMEATYTHECTVDDTSEEWDDSGAKPQIPYISDTFKFVFPELITTDPLQPLDLSKIQSIALHHMAHPTADFKTVEKWHLNQGWRAFGYNFWIDFKGNVHVGRGWNLGAGVANHNSTIISIGFQGDYEDANKSMPTAQYKAGVELIKWISQRVPSIKEVGGHGDYNSTLCPGKYFPLKEMRIEAGF